MKKICCRATYPLIFALLLSVAGCKSAGPEGPAALLFNRHVEAFTSGNISREAPVYILLDKDVAPEKRDAERLSKLVKIKPSVEGNFAFEDARTVVFRPKGGFKRDTPYRVTVDLSEWFEIEEAGDRKFEFGFSTLPFRIRGHVDALDVRKDGKGYDVSCVLMTADRETPETVESMIGFSEAVQAVWQHSPDGRRHQVTLQNVQPQKEDRVIVLSVKSNRDGAERGDLLDVEIPSGDAFALYDVAYKTDPERYVELTFNRILSPVQDMQGLVFLTDEDENLSEQVQSDGNKVRLYPPAKASGRLSVHISAELRDKDDNALGESVVRSVDLGSDTPEATLLGEGVIIPQSEQLTIPFRAVHMRGVVVRVIKILEQNVGQFLQRNRLNGSYELARVGRLVAYKTLFLDEDPNHDLSRPAVYALDLRQLIQPEPGAIYRVDVSINRELSVYNTEPLDRKKIEAQDELHLKMENERYFDDGGFYYYPYYSDYSDYDWSERNDPSKDSYYYEKYSARNVLATNLGLIAMRGEDQAMTVLVHDLLDTRPLADVEVKLFNYQNQQIAQGRTDKEGRVRIAYDSGRPYYVLASLGQQRSYLLVDNASALSLSSFDVSGEVVQHGIKGFIYGERGVWRPGDTLHLGFMLSDRVNKLPEDHPVVMELYNPLGQLYLSKTQNRGAMGLYAFDMPTEPDAPTGAWEVRVQVGGNTFTKGVRIETVKPNRLKIRFGVGERTLLRGTAEQADLHVEWLQGATAKDLKYDIEVSFSPVKTVFDQFKGYVFDDPSKYFSGEEATLISGKTDGQGDASVPLRFDTGYSAPGMLLASLITRVYEPSGDFSLDGARTLYSPYTRYAGILSPQKGRDPLATGRTHSFRVASADYMGKAQAGVTLDVEIYKVNWYWWWSSGENNLADYVSNSYNRPVERKSVTTGTDGTGEFSVSVDDDDWGTYFIRVADNGSRHTTGVMCYFDWPDFAGRRNTDGASSATMLNFKTDKEEYAPGDKMTVTFPSTQGSRAVIAIENGSEVLAVTEHECRGGETSVKLDVTEAMQPNAYVYITLLQPHAHTANDLPIRLYGVVPVKVSSPQSHLHPVIRMADEIRPETGYKVTVSEKSGRPMAYTLAVVDEGLLDLTRFATPDPWKAFNAREALGVNTWDLYDYVVGAYGGRIEQLFSIGGDEALAKGPKAIVNRFKPVVQFAGPFVLGKGDKRTHEWTMPNYNGRVRVMVVAGDGKAYGQAEKSVAVRKPVMLLGTLPRVIGVNEEMAVPATVFATEDGVGEVRVAIRCSDNMQVVGPAEKTLNFSKKDDKQAVFRIRTKSAAGAAHVTLTATAKGETSTYETDIEIRSVRLPQTRVSNFTIEGGKAWEGDLRLPGAPGTNSLTVEVSDVEPLNLTARLSYLIGYPHGCVEQITSKAFPQLYLSEFTPLTAKQQATTEAAVKETIARLRSYQTVDGTFSYWPGGTDSNAWGSIYATHFLVEAERKGYLVPGSLKKDALAGLRRIARNWKYEKTGGYYARSEELTQAYRLYVLALAGSPEMGAMNRLKERETAAPVGRWMLACAYAAVGRTDVAGQLTAKVVELGREYDAYDYTYGSALRDRAIVLQTECLLDNAAEAAKTAREIAAVVSSDDWLSTQSTAFALMAMSQYMNKYKVGQSMDFEYTFDGKSEKVSEEKSVRTIALGEKLGETAHLSLKNRGKQTLFVSVIGSGVPAQGEEKAYANGLTLSVNYVDAQGRTVRVDNLSQGDNFTAVVTVGNTGTAAVKNLALTQVVPAGWEILNTRFMNESQEDTYSAGLSYQDIRDDRVYSYVDLLPAGRSVTVRIDLCAVYPGRFYLPPVNCEAMYDRLIRANTEGRQVVVE